MKIREEKLEYRLKSMPRDYRATYIRAMNGRSMKAGIRSFCLMCFQWQRNEVKVCTDLACPLYPYRPYKNLVLIPNSWLKTNKK